MKRIFIYLLASISLWNLSCSDFLETDNLTKKDSSNFPVSPEDATQSLYGAYSIMLAFDAAVHPFMIGEILSDNRFGGGGQNDQIPQAMNVFKVTSDSQLGGTWSTFYKGIFRCNMLLASLDQITEWDSNEQKNKILGEAHFLRAHYYFTMAQLWGTVPLVIDPTPQNNPKATPEELYGQIFYDLKTAIEVLPSVQQPASELGRATKWAAEALMARAYLFYDGYYHQNARKEVRLVDESTVTANQVIAWLTDCIQNSGHQLTDDFRNQWPYSIDIPEAKYPYAAENNLSWLGEDGANRENMFVIRHSPSGTYDNNYSNQIDIYHGLRDQKQIPFGQGWGFGPVNPVLYNEWPDHDLRKKGSIYNVNDETEGVTGYEWGGDMMWQETGFWEKKYMPINVEDENGEIVNYNVVLYNSLQIFSVNNSQDIVLIRFADVLLMHSELTKTTEGINRVRVRAKLDPIASYSEEALQQERRFELAFENVRYYDLLRWYGKEAGVVLKKNMSGAKIWNMGVETTINRDRNNGYFDNIDQRVRETGRFLQIPNDQIALSDGVLEQNPGWETSNVMF